MKGRPRLVTILGVLLALAVAGGTYALLGRPPAPPAPTATAVPVTATTSASAGGLEVPLPTGAVATLSADTEEYTNSTYGFSLAYPSAYAVHEFKEMNGGMTVVFQGSGQAQGFQIFITPYGEPTITEARFKLDIPSGVVKDPVEVVIGGGITALHFSSVAPIIGPSSETWFIRGGHLYEFTAYAADDAVMAGILKTIHFTE